MSAVRSPRLFGRPIWSWAAVLTMRGHIDKRGRLVRPLRCRVAQRVLWPLCRVLTGHRQALGETGYGGRGMLDVFCAYCYFPWQVPIEEAPSKQFFVDLFHSPPPEIRP